MVNGESSAKAKEEMTHARLVVSESDERDLIREGLEPNGTGRGLVGVDPTLRDVCLPQSDLKFSTRGPGKPTARELHVPTKYNLLVRES